MNLDLLPLNQAGAEKLSLARRQVEGKPGRFVAKAFTPPRQGIEKASVPPCPELMAMTPAAPF
jgi:hypothetical protein